MRSCLIKLCDKLGVSFVLLPKQIELLLFVAERKRQIEDKKILWEHTFVEDIEPFCKVLQSEFNLQQLCLELDLGGEELLRLTKNSTLSQCVNLEALLFQFYDTISSGF